MSTDIGEHRELLEAVQRHITELGFGARLVEPTSEAPFHTLVIRFVDFGSELQSLSFEISIPPGVVAPEDGAFFLQIFCMIAEGVLPAQYSGVQWLTTTLNTKLPLGAFGLIEGSGCLFYKQGLTLESDQALAGRVRTIDRQCGLMIHMLQTFIDPLLDVAIKGLDPVDVLAEHPLGAVYAQAG